MEPDDASVPAADIEKLISALRRINRIGGDVKLVARHERAGVVRASIMLE